MIMRGVARHRDFNAVGDAIAIKLAAAKAGYARADAMVHGRVNRYRHLQSSHDVY
jgi:hypothetical protein